MQSQRIEGYPRRGRVAQATARGATRRVFGDVLRVEGRDARRIRTAHAQAEHRLPSGECRRNSVFPSDALEYEFACVARCRSVRPAQRNRPFTQRQGFVVVSLVRKRLGKIVQHHH